MDSPTRHRHGFTLIEVLVVVAIIALLVSILLPSLAAARDQSKAAVCMANLSDVGKSMRFCLEQYKAYPLLDDGGVTVHANVMATWIDVLYATRMLRNLAIGDCPKDNKPDPQNIARGARWGFTAPNGQPGADYSYGISVASASKGWLHPSTKFNIQKYQSNMVLAADGWWNWMHGFSAHGILTVNPEQGYWGGNTVGYRHGTVQNPVANVLYHDGGVRPARLNVADKYPNTKNDIRGLLTGDKFFWRSGEHTLVGVNSPANNKNIQNEPYGGPAYEYPFVDVNLNSAEKYGVPVQMLPTYWSQHTSGGKCRWPSAVHARKKLWTR